MEHEAVHMKKSKEHGDSLYCNHVVLRTQHCKCVLADVIDMCTRRIDACCIYQASISKENESCLSLRLRAQRGFDLNL